MNGFYLSSTILIERHESLESHQPKFLYLFIKRVLQTTFAG